MASRWLNSAVALAIIGAALFAWFLWSDRTLTRDGEFAIAAGSPAADIWRQLAAEHYTRTSLPWHYWGWRVGAAARLQSGTYQLRAGERVDSVVARFVSGQVIDTALTVTYPEGFTLQQIAARTSAAGIGTEADFLAAAAADQWRAAFPFLKELEPAQSLEGFLFPDTYRLAPDDEPADVIRRMLGTFQYRVIDSGLAEEARRQGHTLLKLVTMASIVEREVIGDDDMALVAGILWQRQSDGVSLDADATVRYALNKWEGPLTYQDLQTDSPYNTRRYAGLPPGPISHPGLRAISAALKPQVSDYYYYLSAPSGETIFSRTLDEHNANKAKYVR